MCEEQELDFYLTLRKINERLSIILYSIRSGVDLTENDINLLSKIFPLWHNGDIVFKEHKLIDQRQSVSQTQMFTDKSAGKSNGI